MNEFYYLEINLSDLGEIDASWFSLYDLDGGRQIPISVSSGSIISEALTGYSSNLSFGYINPSAQSATYVEIESVKINNSIVPIANAVSSPILRNGQTATIDLKGVVLGGEIESPSQDLFSETTIQTTDKSDTLRLFRSDVGAVIDSGLGNDSLYLSMSSDIVAGGAGDDLLRGFSGDDILDGGEGADLIYGDEGNDTIYGGGGDDVLHGNEGDDYISGGEGNDKLLGHEGNDILIGGNGDDRLTGGSGQDTIYGGDGADQIVAGTEEDFVDGGNGDDLIYGGNGDDVVIGGEGDDILYLGNGNDYAAGGIGNDSLYGQGGDDLLNPGRPVEVDEIIFSGQVIDNGSITWGDGQYIYSANNNALSVYSYGGQYLSTTYTTQDIVGIWGDGDYIYTAQGNMGIGAYSFDGSVFTEAAVNTPGNARAVWGDGSYIYVADNTSVIAYSFDGSAFTQHAIYQNFTSKGSPRDGFSEVWGGDGYIYAENKWGLFVLEFNGNEFVELSAQRTDTVNDIIADDGFIYVLHHGYLSAYSFDGVGLDEIANFDKLSFAQNIWIDGSTIYIADGSESKPISLTFDGSSFSQVENSFFGFGGTDNIWSDDDIFLNTTSGFTYLFSKLNYYISEDYLFGGEGADTVVFSSAEQGITIDLTDDQRQNIYSQVNCLVQDVENVVGSEYDDSIVGNELDNILSGSAGNDILFGGSGADVFLFSSIGFLDVVEDFSPSEGDSLDISDIVSGFDVAFDGVSDFVRLEAGAEDWNLLVNVANGSSEVADWSQIAIVKSQEDISIESLYSEGLLVI